MQPCCSQTCILRGDVAQGGKSLLPAVLSTAIVAIVVAAPENRLLRCRNRPSFLVKCPQKREDDACGGPVCVPINLPHFSVRAILRGGRKEGFFVRVGPKELPPEEEEARSAKKRRIAARTAAEEAAAAAPIGY